MQGQHVRGISTWALALAAGAGVVTPAAGQCVEFQYFRNGGQVSISGASLFAPFFQSPASSADWIDANNNGCVGTLCTPVPEQLAPSFDPLLPPPQVFMEVQYRGVGSGNGLNEFVAWQLCGLLNKSVPSEIGLLNGYVWATGGVKTNGPNQGCDFLPADPNNDGWVFPGADGSSSNDPGTYSPVNGIDIAVLDVPSFWAVRAADPSGPSWNRRPLESGYGLNPASASDVTALQQLPTLCRVCPANSGAALAGACDPSTNPNCLCLNNEVASPDANTVFDEQLCWVPIAPIANRGVGKPAYSISEIRHLFVTGRLPSGENLVVATRSIGSGTRNAFMNTAGVDPSYGMGENLSAQWGTTSQAWIGPGHKTSNAGSSGLIEETVKYSRLAVGYTGLAGAGRAADDASHGQYEIPGVIFDDQGGLRPVRPTIEASMINCDPNTGYRLGGFETMVTRGSVNQDNQAAPDYMTNQVARLYVKNIYQAIADYDGSPLPVSQAEWSPAHYLIANFTLIQGMDCIPSRSDATTFVPNPAFSAAVQGGTLLATTTVTPEYGSVNAGGFVPRRITAGQPYADEVTTGQNQAFEGSVAYAFKTSSGAISTFGPGAADPFQDLDGDGIPCGTDPDESCVLADRRLSARNSLQGDFNNDGARNLADVPAMMKAALAPLDFEQDVVPAGGWGGDPGDMSEDVVIVHVIGDFDGNGQFDAQDVRYFADGLAMTTGTDAAHLDRQAGFTAVDEAWYSLTGNGNYFGTVVKNPAGVPTGTYHAGDSRADVAGGAPRPGAAPSGANGVVDCADVTYVAQNFGAFADLDQTINLAGGKRLDLSADMNGDLVINCEDVAAVLAIMGVSDLQACGVVANCVSPCPADINGDHVVDGAEIGLVLGTWGPGTGAADLNHDGMVDGADLGLVLGNWGPCPG
ncbi:MAG: hypothetical protein U0574_10515 [Phycisphaerales bacterium]